MGRERGVRQKAKSVNPEGDNAQHISVVMHGIPKPSDSTNEGLMGKASDNKKRHQNGTCPLPSVHDRPVTSFYGWSLPTKLVAPTSLRIQH